MFNERLKTAMSNLNITQSQVSKLTGIGKSSISQYLSGKNEPTEERKKAIASALGLAADFFDSEEDVIVTPSSGSIPRLTVEEAAKLLGTGTKFVSNGLQDGVFPWGYAAKGRGNKFVYFINAKRFAEIEGIAI